MFLFKSFDIDSGATCVKPQSKSANLKLVSVHDETSQIPVQSK